MLASEVYTAVGNVIGSSSVCIIMTYFRRLCASATWMAVLQAKMPP